MNILHLPNIKWSLHILVPSLGTQFALLIALIHLLRFTWSSLGILKKFLSVPGTCLFVQLTAQQLEGII